MSFPFNTRVHSIQLPGISHKPSVHCTGHGFVAAQSSANHRRVCMPHTSAFLKSANIMASAKGSTCKLCLHALYDAADGLVELLLLGEDGDVVADHAVHQAVSHRLQSQIMSARQL